MFASSTERWKANFSEEVKERVANRADQFANLFGAMLERLSGIADRIEGRIAELEAEGVDVSAASDALATADAKIAAAADAVDAVTAGMADALESEAPQEEIEGLQTLKDTAKTALREAHEALRAAAELLPKLADKEGTTE